jgi:signal transduction histidine kinase
MFTLTERPSARPIVYVDDDPDRRDLFARWFGRDFEVIAVADTPSAVAVLETRDIGVLVGSEDVLRIARERSPRTVRIIVSVDVDRILRVLDDGLAARHIIEPWDEAHVTQVLRWACEQSQRVADLRMWLHDLRTPLTTILANAEHLELLAGGAPGLRGAIARTTIADEHRDELLQILEDLLPIAEDLASATFDIEQVIEQLQALLPGATAAK